jgi:hypothetical protein
MFMRKLAAVVFCLVCAQGTVNAQYRQNVITSAVVDRMGGLVLLTGQFGWNPSVTIQGMTVHVASASPQMMVVELPASLLNQPGTYLLTMTTGSGSKATTFFEISVGAVGPQGPRGTDGAPGAKGDSGPAGAKGDKGDKGEPGVAGRGDKGDKGDKGDPGTSGANGLNGTNGQKGDPGERGPAGDGALQVVDANGKRVGPLVSPDAVIVNIDNEWVRIAPSGAGFKSCTPSSSAPPCMMYMYAEAGCKGTRYKSAEDGLTQEALVIDGDIYYPSGVVAKRAVASYRYDTLDCVDVGSGFEALNAEMKSVPLSSLDVKGPFHLAK